MGGGGRWAVGGILSVVGHLNPNPIPSPSPNPTSTQTPTQTPTLALAQTQTQTLTLTLTLTRSPQLTCRARASSSHSSHRSKPTVPSSDPRSPTEENEGVRVLCASTGSALVNGCCTCTAPCVHTWAALRRARWNAQHLEVQRIGVQRINGSTDQRFNGRVGGQESSW